MKSVDWILVITSGRLTIMLALALVFVQLQCAAQCSVSTCDLTELNRSSSKDGPPCHRHHSDSSTRNHAGPCAQGISIAATADFSAAQASVGAPLVALQPVQPEASPSPVISENEAALSLSSPPGSAGRSSRVLRI